MANVDAPFGLRPVGSALGAPYTGKLTRCYIPSTDTDAAAYIGSLVKLTGTSNEGYPVVTANVATTNAVFGVVVSVVPETADSTIYRENSTSRYVMVCTDPNALFVVQEDSTGGALAAGAVGATCQLTGFTSGSTVTGLSAIEIDSSELSETSDTDDDVRIVGLYQAPDNEIGTNARWIVRLNNHQMINAGVGV